MTSKMWMGPRGGETWVPAPVIGGDFSAVGWSSETQYLNGGAGTRASVASHKEYNMTWGLASRDSLRPITDMQAGKRGPGLIYFTDPFAADKNVLPEQWAFPAQAYYDGVPLIGDTRPAILTTGSGDYDYPTESAVYDLTGTGQKLYLPIPQGYTAWVGVHGSLDTGVGGVRVTAIAPGALGGTAVYAPLLGTNTDQRFNLSYSSNTYQGIELDLATDTATSITIAGMMVQMLPSGHTPALGDFISGQGNSGCRFTGKPTTTAYSAARDKIGMSAKLVEVGTWL